MSIEFDLDIFLDSDDLLERIEKEKGGELKEISIMVCRFFNAMKIEQGYQKKQLLKSYYKFWLTISSLRKSCVS